jgi:hypothetical protein
MCVVSGLTYEVQVHGCVLGHWRGGAWRGRHSATVSANKAGTCINSFLVFIFLFAPPLRSSGQFLATDPEVRVPFPALPDFLRNSGSGTGSNQPSEYN